MRHRNEYAGLHYFVDFWEPYGSRDKGATYWFRTLGDAWQYAAGRVRMFPWERADITRMKPRRVVQSLCGKNLPETYLEEMWFGGER